MIRTLIALSLAGLTLCACKPTYRTAPEAIKAKEKARLKAEQEAAQHQQEETERLAQEAQQAAAKKAAEEAARKAAQATLPPPPNPSHSLLCVNSTIQHYNQRQPWKKGEVDNDNALGISLGNGQVLTVGSVVRAATYVEISLPDQSKTVPAKVLRFDEDLDLALLTVAHEEDAEILSSRVALTTGEAISKDGEATLAGLVDGLTPLHIPVQAEGCDSDGETMPRLKLRAARPLPGGHNSGAPLIKDGKLVGITTHYNSNGMLITAINAEQIQRFLNHPNDEAMPILGMEFAQLRDPVFCQYLKMPANAGGLYISRVHPGAAEEVGIRKGDVLTAIDGMPLDNVGRCKHPLYGTMHATTVLRGHKVVGDTITLTVNRDGQPQTHTLVLNRKALENSLFPEDKPGVQPRYVVWGGLFFQPMTRTLLGRLGSNLPVELQGLQENEETHRAAGRREIVALMEVIPTPATMGYENVRYCLVEEVNGKPVQDFAQFAAMLDEPTENGLVHLKLNKAPYNIYIDRETAEKANEVLQSNAISPLRVTSSAPIAPEAK